MPHCGGGLRQYGPGRSGRPAGDHIARNSTGTAVRLQRVDKSQCTAGPREWQPRWPSAECRVDRALWQSCGGTHTSGNSAIDRSRLVCAPPFSRLMALASPLAIPRLTTCMSTTTVLLSVFRLGRSLNCVVSLQAKCPHDLQNSLRGSASDCERRELQSATAQAWGCRLQGPGYGCFAAPAVRCLERGLLPAHLLHLALAVPAPVLFVVLVVRDHDAVV